jgi:hypothetical protein
MKTRATLALAAVAGLTAVANAQEAFSVLYTWQEVNVGTTTPVAVANSVVDPGEGARIRLQVTALINGSNAVGQTALLTAGSVPGYTSGTVRGLGSVVYDLVGDGGGATANGNWTQLTGPTSVITSGATGGTQQAGGSIIQGFGGSQFVAPGGSALPTNSNVQVMRSVWNPASYASRTVNFLGRASVAVPPGQGNAILLAYDIAQPDPSDPTTFFDNLVGKYIGTNFANGISIPVAPAPSSIALVGLGALVAGRRRR